MVEDGAIHRLRVLDGRHALGAERELEERALVLAEPAVEGLGAVDRGHGGVGPGKRDARRRAVDGSAPVLRIHRARDDHGQEHARARRPRAGPPAAETPRAFGERHTGEQCHPDEGRQAEAAGRADQVVDVQPAIGEIVR